MERVKDGSRAGKRPKKPFFTSKRIADIKENAVLYGIMSPTLIHIFVFCYIPIYGIVIAFQDYYPGAPFIAFDGSVEWVGFKHFLRFFNSYFFERILTNTLVLGGLLLVCGFFVPIVFALLLNEMRHLRLKKIIQTSSYLPHFISMVIVASMVLLVMDDNGMINNILRVFGMKELSYGSDKNLIIPVYVITKIWKTFGWSSILFLSAIASADQEIYEAAKCDGANRFHQAWHLTLPAIKMPIMITLVFSISSLLGADSELLLLISNPANIEKGDVVGTYLYRSGLLGGNFSSASAVGLLSTTAGFILLYLSNTFSKKFLDFSLW